MLSSHRRLFERQGKYGTPRQEYLQELVSAFQGVKDTLRREEILANLSNFAYDPINYVYLKELHVITLFLDVLAMSKSELNGQKPKLECNEVRHKNAMMEFALGGICNCIADPRLQLQFFALNGANEIIGCVRKLVEISDITACVSKLNQLLSAMTICYFLLDSSAFHKLTTNSTCMNEYDSNETVRQEDSILCIMQGLQRHHSVQIANIASAFDDRHQELLALYA
uniref:Uncharacterized protein AlNc14C1831G13079 n=1 Tax=Albugo laibachii Nc14 TaxID=890382 RepID=F0X2U6_9STRA|nr:conserved hypothetical protein [Albugo laibachii Nc14]|eukprot:CCA28260.1 conserved hypothetical protein [Albugo laibachii Nc14]